jgi:hypothetical protein
MATNLAIDDKLIEEAHKTGGHKTKKEAVTTALQEYIQHRRQHRILADFGAVDWTRNTITRPNDEESAHRWFLVDTPVWSLSLRRRAIELSPQERQITRNLYESISRNQVQILGATRQEVLSGIREESQFQRIRDHLRDFENVKLDSGDSEDASQLHNKCRQSGITGSPVDVLICATSLRRDWEIFTTDRDCGHYARMVPLKIFQVPESRIS